MDLSVEYAPDIRPEFPRDLNAHAQNNEADSDGEVTPF
jgi:hypothetical protein